MVVHLSFLLLVINNKTSQSLTQLIMQIETRLVLYPDVYRVDLVSFWSVEDLSSVNYTKICRVLAVGARKKPPSGKTELSIAWKTGFHEEGVQDRPCSCHSNAIDSCLDLNMLKHVVLWYLDEVMLHVWICWEV